MHIGRIVGVPDTGWQGRPVARMPLAGLLAIVAARQAATPTAFVQRRLSAMRPRLDAAFARPVAEALAGWGA